MEIALERINVPFIVMTINTNPKNKQKQTLGTFNLEFSQLIHDKDRLTMELTNKKPNNFRISTEQKMVILYKIHGSFNGASEEDIDNLIISDDDYILFIRKMLDKSIPGCFLKIFRESPFLFLGYSLRDWNIRSFFLKVQEKRPNISKARIKDFAILKPLTEYDKCIFDQYNIDAYDIDLNNFIKGLKPYAKKIS